MSEGPAKDASRKNKVVNDFPGVMGDKPIGSTTTHGFLKTLGVKLIELDRKASTK